MKFHDCQVEYGIRVFDKDMSSHDVFGGGRQRFELWLGQFLAAAN
jgi:hypothetical protein